MKLYLKYLLLLLLFPLFFLVHGINENFGLVPTQVAISLLIKYLLISIGIYLITCLFIRQPRKSFITSFIILLIYFFFGAIKDGLPFDISYKLLLPLVALITVALFIIIRKSHKDFSIPGQYISYLLILLLAVEAFSFLYNAYKHKDRTQDFGDRDNKQLSNLSTNSSSQSNPDIFWLVFDMYPSSSSLKKIYDFNNPLDSSLIQKGFYVAAGARSNYNYTHYSLVSSLDMSYLDEFTDGAIVTAKDMVRGNYSLKENNVTKYLLDKGYNIVNYSIYDLKRFPSKGLNTFRNNEGGLIDHQTLYERVSADIGWNFMYGFNKSKHETDSIFSIRSVEKLDSSYKSFLSESQGAIKSVSGSAKPVFYLLHVMLPHEPYIYKADGTLQYKGYNSDPALFLDQLKYTNTVAESVVDNILQSQKDRKTVILLQGDHGYKFDRKDKHFKSESCNIFYAVYTSEKQYGQWYPTISGVNSFRVLFNETFKEKFPLLGDSSMNLEYRKYK